MSPIKKDLASVLEANRKKIVVRYASYLRCIRRFIEEKISVSELRSYLLSLEAFDSESDCNVQQKLLSGMRAELEKASTIHQMFDLVTKECASFLNFEIFQCIVEEYDIDHGQEALKYSEHLHDYVEKHKISEFVAINPKLLESTENSEELVLKLDIDTMRQLTRITDLQKVVSRILNLLPSALRLYSIEDGCVVVTFHLPKLVADKIFSKSKQFSQKEKEEFCSLFVSWLSYGGRKFIFNKKDMTSGNP